MDNLIKLMYLLKEEKLDKNYREILSSLKNLEGNIFNVSDAIDDVMLQSIADKDYDKLPVLTDIQVLVRSAVDDVHKVLLNFDTEESIDVQHENTEELKGFLTSVDGLRVGAQLIHNTYGLGKILSIEDGKNTDIKTMIVKFEDGERKFNCTQEVLDKYFVSDDSVKSDRLLKKEAKLAEMGEVASQGYNLYTNPDFFRYLKPISVSIFGTKVNVTSWRDVCQTILTVLYKKDENIAKASMLKYSSTFFSENANKLRAPLQIGENAFCEGHGSSEYLIKGIASVAEDFLNVYNKDVRRNILIFLKQEK